MPISTQNGTSLCMQTAMPEICRMQGDSLRPQSSELHTELGPFSWLIAIQQFSNQQEKSIFDVEHSCIYHKEGLCQTCKAFQSPAMHCLGKDCGWFVFQRVMYSSGLYSLSDLFE